jgi:hypothetical protein
MMTRTNTSPANRAFIDALRKRWDNHGMQNDTRASRIPHKTGDPPTGVKHAPFACLANIQHRRSV